MHQRHKNRNFQNWGRIREQLVYLPGAVVIAYGFWLSLSF